VENQEKGKVPNLAQIMKLATVAICLTCVALAVSVQTANSAKSDENEKIQGLSPVCALMCARMQAIRS
jgi:hypothetical protein